jgi:hypothetical protein
MSRSRRQELRDHISAPLADVYNVVAWWGVSTCFLIGYSLIFASSLYPVSHHVQPETFGPSSWAAVLLVPTDPNDGFLS